MRRVLFDFFRRNDVLTPFCSHFGVNKKDTELILNIPASGSVNYLDVVHTLHIDLTKPTQNVSVMCKHGTAIIDDFESLQKYGLLNLSDCLQLDTPLKKLLAKFHIVIDLPRRTITFQGKPYQVFGYTENCKSFCYKQTHCCEGTNPTCDYRKAILTLFTKLFHDKCETEVFIRADYNDISKYSTIKLCPEILSSLDHLLRNIAGDSQWGNTLQREWRDTRNREFYVLEFPAKLNDFDIYTGADISGGYDYKIEPILLYAGFTYSDLINKKVPRTFFENLFLLQRTFDSYIYDTHCIYAQLLPTAKIPFQTINPIRLS